MKVYFNRKPVHGPWGGGTKVLQACVDAFKAAGHETTYVLDPNVDVIFCFDPRPGPDPEQLSYEQLLGFARQALASNKRMYIVQRVGDIGTHGKPDLTRLVMASSMHSDTVIFPSLWALDSIQHVLMINDVRPQAQWHVIPNAPLKLFYKDRRVVEALPEKISFVTHHWSTNEKKGFLFYELLNEWCKKNGHTFRYIGRSPPGFSVKVDGPLSAKELAEELPKSDVYVSASEVEAGANHVLEGMAAGLPVLYHNDGGSTLEYCRQYGVGFDGTIENFEQALNQLRIQYPKIRQLLKRYKATIEDSARQYVTVVEGLIRG